MENRKVKTMAEMANEYKATEEDFREQIENGKVFPKSSTPMFDGENFYPQHQDRVYRVLGTPFKTDDMYAFRSFPKDMHINISYTKKELEILLKELTGIFARNFKGTINDK